MVISEEAWEEKYTATTNSPIQYEDIPEDTADCFVWTLVEGENEDLWIKAGYRIINTIGYYVTEKRHFNDVTVSTK